jgi:rubrerythrin
LKKIFTKETSDKILLSKMYKELLKFNNKEINNLILKWAKDLNGHFKEVKQMANKHMNRCSTSYVIRGLQMNTTV